MRVAVAMSGGVDSSVAAIELKNKGYDVIGLTMKTWPTEECGAAGEKLCCSLESIQYARSVAEDLDVPYYVVNLSEEFAREVTGYFAEEYAKGRTPNPCVFCNSKVKFGHLLSKARQIGAERIATGHYARIVNKDGRYFIAEAVDRKKDQTYFLYDIAKDALSFIDFPVGEYTKDQVRAIAKKNGFMSANREESQDICFATADGDYRKYLAKIGVKAFTPGNIVDMSGKVVGKHEGIASYTIGQRKGLGVAMGEPVYVLKIDTVKNVVVLGPREHAMRKAVRLKGMNWFIDESEYSKPFETMAKIRYATPKTKAAVTVREKDDVLVEFAEPQFAPTPGQAAVFYDGDLVIGGGWIEEVVG